MRCHPPTPPLPGRDREGSLLFRRGRVTLFPSLSPPYKKETTCPSLAITSSPLHSTTAATPTGHNTTVAPAVGEGEQEEASEQPTGGDADLREDADGEDHHAGGREQRHHRQRQGQDPGKEGKLAAKSKACSFQRLLSAAPKSKACSFLWSRCVLVASYLIIDVHVSMWLG